MKKRLISFLLACILVFSSLPAISAQDENVGAENAETVATYQEFVAFLDKAVNRDEANCKITADIVAPADCDFIGGYNIKDVHIDGNGHTVKGLKIKDALFATFESSSLRNLTFDDASVESSLSQGPLAIAVVAQSIKDRNSNITGCVFNNCTITLPDAETNAAFVAVENHGIVTNCVVSDTSKVKNTAQSSAPYRVGGITVDNISGSKVINCVSKIGLELNADDVTAAGIAVSNEGMVDLCYVSSKAVGDNKFVADSSSTGTSVYRKDDNSFMLGKTSYSSDKVSSMTAEMSQNAMNYVSNYDSSVPLTEPDYTTLWCVEGGEPALSFDLKTAQVYLMIDETMAGAELDFSLGAEDVSVNSEKRFSLAVGKYVDGGYKRNSLTITYDCGKDDYKMVNNFVYSPVFRYTENLINPYDSNNYSTQLIKAEQNGTVNTGVVDILPYCWDLSLTNTSENDEIVDYDFGGKGTEDAPYTIDNAYELNVLSRYVADGKTNSKGTPYNVAHYLLTTDLNGITIEPIGRYGNAVQFAGTFDGGSHVISNLTITDGQDNTDNYFGLFGYVKGGDSPAVIKNLNVMSANVITQGDLCGVIAGTAQNAIINGCVTSGNVSGGTQVSGIVGYANHTEIYNCGSTASLTTSSPNASAGGIVGYSEFSNVRNCYFAGRITNNNIVKPSFLRVGGVTGHVDRTTFDHCFHNAPDAAFTYFDASISGISKTTATELKSDGFLTQIRDYSSKAAFGTLWGKDTNNINSGYPIICEPSLVEYSILCIPTEAGTVSSDVPYALKGTKVTLTVNSTYKLKEIQITNLNREVQNIKCSETQDGKYEFVMPCYDVRVVPVFEAEVHLSGMGTIDDPYIVSNFAELSLMSDKCYHDRPPREGCESYPGAYYELANDIDGKDQILCPMGNRYYPFNGHFDGNGHTISNIVPKANPDQVSHDYAYPAIFGYCGSAEIHDLTLEGIKLSGARAAVVASTAWENTDIYNVTIRNCTFDNVDGAGGFVSQGTHTRIVNCHADNITFTNAVNSAYVIANVLKSIYINNILVENSRGVKKMIKGSNAAIKVEDYTNCYSCNTDISEEAYIQQSLINKVDESKLSDKVFIAELSENAYYINLNNTFNYFNFWGLSDKIEIAHKNGVTGILPIYYADEFDDPNAYEVFSERVYASEIGYTVEIPYTNLIDASRIKITTPTKKSVGFSIVEKPNGEFALAFVMPEEPVTISNGGVVPKIEDIPGTGTAEDPYRVSVPEHIVLISDVTNGQKMQYKDIPEDVDYIKAQFVLINDIDMTGYEYTPIGQTGLYFNADPTAGESKGYTGTFDGQGYVIKNLTVKGSSGKDLSYGLFGTVSGTVKNIGLENFKYNGAGKDSRVGAVAGQVLKNGKIIDCYSKNVDINTKVNTNNGVAGGIAGANYAGEVSNCYSYNVKITAGRSGGIVADNYGDANGSNGTDRPGKVTNCYTNSAGICGRGDSEGGQASVSDTAFRSYEMVYNLVNGREDSLWRQGSDKLPALKGDMVYKNLCKDEYFYSTVDGDFEQHDIDHDHGEVRCKRCNHFDSATLITNDNYKSLGLTSSYVGMYAIENASNMYWFNEQHARSPLTGGIVLLNDITINNAVEPWTPMIVDGSFTFDGNGHTLTLNLDFGNTASSDNKALFSTYNYAFVRDLVIKGSVKANTTGHVGGFASSMYRSTVERVISYADVTNNCTTGGTAGGIAGYYGGQMDYSNGLYSQILNSAVYADVKGYEAGGIVGHGWNGKQYYDIKNSAFVGDVTGIGYQGAIIGYHGNNQDAHTCTFKDIYYLEKDGLAFSGGGNTNYTLDSTVTAKTEAEFASGEVAYLLNNGKTDGAIWKQNIDNGKAKDALPVHTGGTVYKNTTCIGELIEYSNTADAVVHDYNSYCVCRTCIGLEPGEIAGIYGFDLSLAESISLKYYMVIDKETAADPTAKMVFTVPDGSKENPDETYIVTIPVSEAEHDGTFYYFTCGIPAKEMGSDIYCQIVTDTSESRNFRYSVKEYAEYILANPEMFEEEIPLVKAMLNYGGYTQIDLEHKTDNLANTSQYITEEEKILPKFDFLPYNYIISGEQKGVSYYGASLSLLSETTINLYFYFKNEADVTSLDITVDGEKVIPVKNNSYYEIEISSVPADMLHRYHTVKVGSLTLYYSVFSFAASVQKNGNDPVLLDLCWAMYVYNTEAVKYHSK